MMTNEQIGALRNTRLARVKWVLRIDNIRWLTYTRYKRERTLHRGWLRSGPEESWNETLKDWDRYVAAYQAALWALRRKRQSMTPATYAVQLFQAQAFLALAQQERRVILSCIEPLT